MESNTPTIFVTNEDLEKLIEVSEASPLETARKLEDELFRANIVSQKDIPNDVVTMNSKIRFVDLESDELREISLVFPHKQDPHLDRVSVLSPVGAALLGLRIGEEISWPLPTGRTKKLVVKEILYQPEAAGDWDL